jgi:hypothetical protein
MWHFLPRAQKFAVHFTLHGKIFRNFVALKTYPIAGYPNERIFGISCIGLLTHHSCRGSALLYSNFGKTLLWHVPDLSQSGS